MRIIRQTKLSIGVISFLFLSLTPLFVFAQSSNIQDLLNQIQQLTQQVLLLQSQLNQLQPGTTTTTVAITGLPQNFTFTTTLKLGMSSLEVKYLQIFLNSDSGTRVSEIGAGSLGQETNYFGLKTQAAVIKFQEKYAKDILTPLQLTKGTGFVGGKTISKINEILWAQPATSAPVATTPTPSTSAAVCGNNKKEISETCDGADLGIYGNGQGKCILYNSLVYQSGDLSCSADCKTIILSNCQQKVGVSSSVGGGGGGGITITQPTSICGNNNKETGETCDGTNLGEFGTGINKCISYSSSYKSGNLSCSSDCKSIITSNCVPITPSPPTLSVNLTVSQTSSNWSKTISGQVPLTGVDLKAEVSGTAIGTINYFFDCTNDGTWDSPDNSEYKGITPTTKEFANGCSYSIPGTYTARVKVERNIAPPAYDTVTITVSQPAPICGDNTCNGTETCSTCPSDCGSCPTIYNASISNASGNPGASSVSVPITLNNIGTREIIGIDIQLTYDSSLITAIDIQKGSLTQNWNLEKNINTAGQVKIALYSSAKLTSSGEVAKVIFSVKTTAPVGSTSALTLTKFDANETTVPSITNGAFTIQSISSAIFNNNLASVLSAIQETIKKIQFLIPGIVK